MVKKFKSFNEEEQYQGYIFSVYKSEVPKDMFSAIRKLMLIEDIEIINLSDSETISFITVIKDMDNKYLKSYIIDVLYNLDKYAISQKKYTDEDIEYLKNYYSNGKKF